jgi:hypothetical protein
MNTDGIHICDRSNIMAVLALSLYLCLRLASASLSPDGHLHGGPGKSLGRAFSKPPNIATNLDCAIKELAWDYAKNLLMNVSANSLRIYAYHDRDLMILQSIPERL